MTEKHWSMPETFRLEVTTYKTFWRKQLRWRVRVMSYQARAWSNPPTFVAKDKAKALDKAMTWCDLYYRDWKKKDRKEETITRPYKEKETITYSPDTWGLNPPFEMETL